MRLPYATLTAKGGQPGGHTFEGGDGYSGGGGGLSSAGNGGSNGGNGGRSSGKYSYTGGSGTGKDISSYYMSQFSLSPGQGGQNRGKYGGGGGGVLVGGDGPSRKQGQGEGYGGGGAAPNGGDYSESSVRGLPGVILVEVV